MIHNSCVIGKINQKPRGGKCRHMYICWCAALVCFDDLTHGHSPSYKDQPDLYLTFTLLALDLISVNPPPQVRLIDAGFLWTEPHSKRIKLKVTIQKEVSTRVNPAGSYPLRVPPRHQLRMDSLLMNYVCV